MREFRARIYRDGKIAGAGFLLDNRQVMTCAHVVEGANRIKVDFPTISNKSFSARVTYLRNDDDDNAAIGEPHDIAVLCLEVAPGEELPRKARPCVFNEAGPAKGESVRFYGFPEIYDHGKHFNGRAQDRVAHGYVQIDPVDYEKDIIEQGVSGAAACSADDRVIGMVVAKTESLAYIMPAATLCNLIKILRGQSPPGKATMELKITMVDREEHGEEFDTFYQEKFQEMPFCPQFYFLHGYSTDSHHSFIDRMRDTFIRSYQHPDFKIAVPFQATIKEWPTADELKTAREQLLSRVFKGINFYHAGNNRTLYELCSLGQVDKINKIILVHDINPEDWNSCTGELIREYIKYFSDDRCLKVMSKQFIVFLNIHYSPIWWKNTFGKFSEKRIVSLLQKIEKEQNGYCAVKIISKFCRVEERHINGWERWIKSELDVSSKLKLERRLENITTLIKKRKSLAMEEVEKHLRPLLVELDADASGLHDS